MRRTTMKAVAVAAAAMMALAACGGDNGGNGDGGDTDTGNGTAPDTDAGGETDDGGDGGGELPDDPVRVAYLATGSALPMFVTAEKYADEIGINLQMEQVGSGNEAITGVATGQYEVGFAGIGSAAYNAVDEGLPVRYVAPMHSGYLEDYFIISAEYASSQEDAEALAEDMSQFEGETFAVNAPGVVTEALLGQALERVGLSFDAVNVEFIPFGDQVPALANGAIVGSILSEPFPTQAEENGSGYRPWETPDTPPMPFTGIIYNTDWAEANPELARGYMEAYLLAAEDLASNGWDTEEMLDIVEQYTGADPAVVAASRQHHITADLSVDFDVLMRYQEFYMEQGSLNYDELLPEEDVWDLQWRDAVVGG